MKRWILILFLVVGGIWIPPAAHAQAPAPEVIGGTVSISAELRANLEAYLQDFPPSPARFYAPTYVQNAGPSMLVSLAALDIASPEDPWTIEGSDDRAANVIWAGTVRIYADGTGTLFSSRVSGFARHAPKLAAPLFAPGGGAEIHLPFDFGKSMMYGVRLVHGEGDYGTSGMYAVDLVGGPSLGSNVASSSIFASAAGTVDYVCADDHSTAIRTYDAVADNTFVYAHLIDNELLVLDQVFSTGNLIGALQPGTYDDDCGWTEQDPDIYHIHWMFEPADGLYRVGNYTIKLSDKKIHAGDKVYGAGSWILNDSSGTGYDNPGSTGSAGGTPNFWDGITRAIVLRAAKIADALPRPNTAVISTIHSAATTASLFFRLTWILVRGSLHLSFLWLIFGAIIAVRMAFLVPWLVMWVIRVVRQIKQTFSPVG